MRTINGIKVYWRDLDDLPSSCGTCPFYFDGTTHAPMVGTVQERGLCNIRGMMKGRWSNVPISCANFFTRIMAQPDGGRYVIVLKDEK